MGVRNLQYALPQISSGLMHCVTYVWPETNSKSPVTTDS